VFRETALVISDHAIVNELLEKRGSIYSSRPDFPMLREFISRNTNLAFNLSDDAYAFDTFIARRLTIGSWRRLRRAVHRGYFDVCRACLIPRQNCT
jgi:hypothetical protein